MYNVLRGFSLGSHVIKGEKDKRTKGQRDNGKKDNGTKGRGDKRAKTLHIIEVLCCILGTCRFLFLNFWSTPRLDSLFKLKCSVIVPDDLKLNCMYM